jgi:transposase
VPVASVARKHGLARNVLYYWRKVYREMAQADLTQTRPAGAANEVAANDSAVNEVADLRLQVRNLERLLGQRTLELELLRERLGKVEEDEAQY